MARRLPPLNSLRAFVEAAKYESFTKAASELGVTQGAVSKQINLLENYLGLNLFERKHQSLALTKLAKTYLASVNDALNSIEQATTRLAKKDNKKTLNISILPSLTPQWLIPMLNDFSPLYDINVEIGSGYGTIDFDKNSTDIAIRIGKEKDWKNFCVEKLIDEKLICACSPNYLTKKHSIKNAADLASRNLLNNTSRPFMWKNYLKSLGLRKLDIKHDVGFEHFFMLIEAAKDGAGIALLPQFLIKKELENGSLVIAFKPLFISGYGYYLIYPKQKAHSRKIEDFIKWAKKNIRA
jgi:LysR family glycine cleavage system transcriptional activator